VLPPGLRDLVVQVFGVSGEAAPGVALADVRVAASRLPDATRDRLVRVVGPQHVLTDDAVRLDHAHGMSTPDLLRLRAGDVSAVPDAVVRPGGHAEVLEVLRCCAASGVAVVPFGGGTSVVGGLAPEVAPYAAVVALDLGRLDRLVALDATSATARLEAGMRGPAVDAALGERGFTLGHLPQSYERATVGGYAATRSSGQASTGYGGFADLVQAVRVATPVGSLDLGRAPASAAGPDLRQLVLGSEGAFGVVTEVTVRVQRRPSLEVYEAWRFDTFAGGVDAVRRVAQSSYRPTVVRLSDEAETGVDALSEGREGRGSRLVLGFAGETEEVALERAGVAAIVRAAGAHGPDEQEGGAWAAQRFAAPYLRDALLDLGLLVETMETAGFWSRLLPLYERVREALSAALTSGGLPAIVLCHVSHAYPTGASLYFTVAARQTDEPLSQWERAKRAAGDAVMAAGGTITHHHGVGRDHRRWMVDEIGPLGVEVLRAVKARLDPAGILNPGVLIP
jgi:alkyldihydroxyacetonephosphate synthase